LRTPAIYVFTIVGSIATAFCLRAETEPLREGSVLNLGGRSALVKKLATLPYVENDYTRRFKFDSYDNPKLTELRNRYKLEDIVAPGQGEFEKQVLLMDWAHQQFKKFGQPSTGAKGALEILKAIDEGHAFFCSQYAQLFVSGAASLGWIDRPIALRRHKGVNKVGGSTEHSVTEIWSNQHRKWVMLDPTSNMYLERGGVPLNAYEIRQEWFYNDGTNLTFVVVGKRYKKSDLPIFLKRFPGFGDLAVDPDELDKYGFVAYIPNTDLMDSGFDYAKMFIVKDSLCDGTKWHIRAVPANPAEEPYFPLGQAALTLLPDGPGVQVTMRTMTPNFARFEVRLDGGQWTQSESNLVWKVHNGMNRLEARTVNRFGVNGPISMAELEIIK